MSKKKKEPRVKIDITAIALDVLSPEQKTGIKESSANINPFHFGISMALRNIMYQSEVSYVEPLSLGLKYPITNIFNAGELGENYLFEKLWRILNDIELTEENEIDLKKITEGKIYSILLEDKNRQELIKYFELLKERQIR